MASIDRDFAEAAEHWDLDKLYQDLASVKAKNLTPVEKQHLRGLLCGFSPAEIAGKLHKSVKGVEIALCNTLYQYVKSLVGQSNGKVENWRNISEWLEAEGYKQSNTNEEGIRELSALEILINQCDISVRNCDLSIKNNYIKINLNICINSPLTSEVVESYPIDNTLTPDRESQN
jgi:hypothetical protein